jgi:MFS family permease
VFAGFAYSLVGVVGRAIINERIPLEMQGRVFAAVNVLTNLSSVAPLLVAGALADLLGVRPVILMVCVLVSAFIVWFVLRERTVRPLRGGLHG